MNILKEEKGEMKMSEKVIIYGKMDFQKEIDITDPCYDRDEWYRLNEIPIKPGEYICYTVKDIKGEGNWEVTKRIGIIHKSVESQQENPDVEWSVLGVIGVDAGLAGFFNDKKDYKDREWGEFCDHIGIGGEAWIYDNGFFSNSGYGDGSYVVYGRALGGKETDHLEIRFIEE